MIPFVTTTRSFALPLLVIGLVNLAGMSECSRVDSSVTAPDSSPALGSPSRDECIEQCNRAAKESLLAEGRVHDTNLLECDRNPACIDEERERHNAVMLEIRTDYNECVESCHDQGGGSGGE
jgi:hypothetical protein